MAEKQGAVPFAAKRVGIVHVGKDGPHRVTRVLGITSLNIQNGS